MYIYITLRFNCTILMSGCGLLTSRRDGFSTVWHLNFELPSQLHADRGEGANEQSTCHDNNIIYMYMFLMRDEKEERKKQARSNKQTRKSNTAHPRQSLFLEKMSCLGWDSKPRHSIL